METQQMTARKHTYGLVKRAVIEGHSAGLTYAEAMAKYGVLRTSLYTASKRLGLPLKPSKHTK